MLQGYRKPSSAYFSHYNALLFVSIFLQPWFPLPYRSYLNLSSAHITNDQFNWTTKRLIRVTYPVEDSPKFLNNKVHKVPKKTEINALSRMCQWHRERQRWSVQSLDNFWDKSYAYKFLIKLANNLRYFMRQ